MDEFMPPWASLLTYTGLAGLVVLSLIRGWIIPVSTVDKIIEQKDRAIDDRDKLIHELQARNDALDQRNDLLASQVHQLVSHGNAPASFATSQAGQGDDPAGGVPGAADSGGQDRTSPVRSKATGNGKPRRRGSSRR